MTLRYQEYFSETGVVLVIRLETICFFHRIVIFTIFSAVCSMKTLISTNKLERMINCSHFLKCNDLNHTFSSE